MITAALEWMDRAVCAQWPGFTEMPEVDQVTECRRCPVRFQCVELGLTATILGNETDGVVYGGLTTSERRVLRKRRAAA